LEPDESPLEDELNALSCFSGPVEPQLGHFTDSSSDELNINSSKAWPHAGHLNSYMGIGDLLTV
jgi:hypothetical protein